ncbi:MAG: hypothetical protein D6816_17000 [Bacteroidetes bacterium]|nr:MAG: hypothetical protein D6816_17000 [Bacteroidota bacterium]
MTEFYDHAVIGEDEFFKQIRYDLDVAAKDPANAFTKFLRSAVDADVYIPGASLEETAFREGYRMLARQLLTILQGDS